MDLKNKTKFVTKEEAQGKGKYFLLDATGKTLGRFASEVAKILRGKHKVDFTPNVDTGDAVIVINADKIAVTGSKEVRKVYRSYTGFMGGLKEIPYNVMMKKNPEYIVYHAVKCMMPKSKLADKQLKKLKVFVGADHGMQAQMPISVNI